MKSTNQFKLLSETKKDFKNSWQLFKENYKAFLSTELFAFLSFILTMIIVFSLTSLIYFLIPSLSMEDFWVSFSENFSVSYIFQYIIVFIAFIILFGFFNCQNGLAYDIMSSGEMFAEFKSSFTYFRRYWWQYFLLSILILIGGFGGVGIYFNDTMENLHINTLDVFQIVGIIIGLFVFFIWFLIFINTLPSITAQGNLKHCFIENFRILRKSPKRLILTWGIFFLIFIIPPLTIRLIIPLFQPFLISSIVLFILLGLFILNLIIVGFPMLSLIATGIYNNVEFERFKPFHPSKNPHSIS